MNSSVDKIYLQDFTFALTIQVDSKDRLSNLERVIDWINYFFDSNILLLEVDGVPRCQYLSSVPHVTYQFVRDTEKILFSTYYNNLKASLVRTPIFALWDVDVIVCPEQLIKAIKAIRSRKFMVASPYDGRFYNVEESIKQEITARIHDKAFLNDFMETRTPMNHHFSVGGAILFDKATFIEMGMENQYINGWGPEDCERIKRAEILGYKVFRVAGPVLHLSHPRGLNSGYASNQQAIQSKKEYLKVCKMSRPELAQYVKTWPWILSGKFNHTAVS